MEEWWEEWWDTPEGCPWNFKDAVPHTDLEGLADDYQQYRFDKQLQG